MGRIIRVLLLLAVGYALYALVTRGKKTKPDPSSAEEN